MVHLPDVRLRAPDPGRARGHHALAVLAGIRGSPPAVRLGGEQRVCAVQAAPDRVFASRHQLHRHVQAQAAPPRRGGLRLWLGRSAHADAVRPAPPWLHARVHPQFLRAHRRVQGRVHGRLQFSGALSARGSQPSRPACHGRAAPGEAAHHELSRGPERDVCHREQPRGRKRRHARRDVLQRAVDRGRRLHGGAAEEV